MTTSDGDKFLANAQQWEHAERMKRECERDLKLYYLDLRIAAMEQLKRWSCSYIEDFGHHSLFSWGWWGIQA